MWILGSKLLTALQTGHGVQFLAARQNSIEVVANVHVQSQKIRIEILVAIRLVKQLFK